MAIAQHEVRDVPLSLLKPAAYNPRKMDDASRAALSASMERFGLVDLIVWNEDTGNIVGGHRRYEKLIAEGTERTSVVVVHLDDEHEKALNIALNSPLLAGEYTADIDKLLDELSTSQPAIFEELQLGGLFQNMGEEVNRLTEWGGMPSFVNVDQEGFRTIVVHFAEEKDFNDFQELIGQEIGKRHAIWFPAAEIGHVAHQAYAATEDEKTDAA